MIFDCVYVIFRNGFDRLGKILTLKNVEFAEVYKNHCSKINKLLIIYINKNDKNAIRLGISVNKSVGNSVVRHRFCRLVRESFRLNKDKIKNGYDIVVVARPLVVGLKCQDIEKSFMHLLSLHHLIKEDEN